MNQPAMYLDDSFVAISKWTYRQVEPALTWREDASFVLNKPALAAIGNPTHVSVRYSPRHRQVCVEATPAAPDAFKITGMKYTSTALRETLIAAGLTRQRITLQVISGNRLLGQFVDEPEQS